MASNREKLVNLIVANSNLEPSEATELIEEYTNNVADNEVEDLINAMTEALGTKAGNKLDANGIKEVFDIAREHSNIKTDQEVAEEQARKQAIDEKQTQRTGKAYEIIEQKRIQREQESEEKKNQKSDFLENYQKFMDNEKIINDYKNNILNSDFILKFRQKVLEDYKSISPEAQEKTINILLNNELSTKIKEGLIQQGLSEAEANRIVLQMKCENAYQGIVPAEKQTEKDRKTIFQLFQRVSKKEEERPRGETNTEPVIVAYDEDIRIKTELYEILREELSADPNNEIKKARLKTVLNDIVDSQKSKREVSNDILKQKAGYLDPEKKIKNTYARQLELTESIDKQGKKIHDIKEHLKTQKDPEKIKFYYETIHDLESILKNEIRELSFEKNKGSELDLVVLQEGMVNGEVNSENYKEAIEDYKEMQKLNEYTSTYILVQQYRKEADDPNKSKEERLALLERIYMTEKDRIHNAQELYGANPTEWLRAIQEQGGLTKEEAYEIRKYRVEKSKEPPEVKNRKLETIEKEKQLVDNFSKVLESMRNKGVSLDDMDRLVFTIQETKGRGDYNRQLDITQGGDLNIIKTFERLLNKSAPGADKSICELFVSECCNHDHFVNIGDLMNSNKIFVSNAIAEEVNRYNYYEHKKEAEEHEPKYDEQQSLKKLSADVTKGEMDSITGTLAKDRNKPEITGQEQSETQTEIET